MTSDNNAQAATSEHAATPPSTRTGEKEDAITSHDQISLPVPMTFSPVRTDLFANFDEETVGACVPDQLLSIAESQPSNSVVTHNVSDEGTNYSDTTHSCVTTLDPLAISSTTEAGRDADNVMAAADKYEESAKKMQDEFAKLVATICGNKDSDPP